MAGSTGRQEPTPPSPDGAEAGGELRWARLRLGLPVDGLARRSGVPAGLVDALEDGALQAFPDRLTALEALRRVAGALGLNANRLTLVALDTWATSSAPRVVDQTAEVVLDPASLDALPSARPLDDHPGQSAEAQEVPGPGAQVGDHGVVSPTGHQDNQRGIGRRSKGRHVRRRRRPPHRHHVASGAVVLALAGAGLVTTALVTQDHAPAPAHDLGTIPASGAQTTTAVQSQGTMPVRAQVPATAPIPTSTTTTAAPPVTLPVLVPVGLRIPAIGVSTTVISLGLNADGTLQVPPLTEAGVHEAGWYDLGPTPGQRGPAIIVGHVDSYQGAGVFFRLGALKPGDIISVTRADKSVATFRVDAVDTYAKDHFPSQTVYGPVGYAGLRLITCGGAFDSTTRQYLSNVVVYASLVAPTPTTAHPATTGSSATTTTAAQSTTTTAAQSTTTTAPQSTTTTAPQSTTTPNH